MNNQILNKVDEIVEYIKNSDDYKKYLFLKEKMEEDNNLKELINDIKVKQKELVKLKYNHEDYSLAEKELDNMISELEDIPIYLEYINLQQELNQIFDTMKNSLDKCFDQNK